MEGRGRLPAADRRRSLRSELRDPRGQAGRHPARRLDRAREILFNLEKQELDESGWPRLARHGRTPGDRNQLLLFAEDREAALFRELQEEIEALDLASLTPLEGLNVLAGLKGRLGPAGPDQ